MSDPRLRVVLYEGHGATALGDTDRFEVLKTLLVNGHTVTCVSRDQSTESVTPQDDAPLLVMGLFEDQPPAQTTSTDDAVTIYFRDITDLDADAVLGVVDSVTAESESPTNKPGGWKPWFPVIDYDRCTNCMQCLSFCLFGVYGASDKGEIQVQNQNKCKTDCPACSRVCPEVAIMFPKYKAGPIKGDLVKDSDVKREAMKVDISSLLGGDIYSKLRQRSDDAKQRFAAERDEQRAINERKRCLKRLAAKLDIPEEALTSLPTADVIQENAAKAAQAAKDALERQAATT